MKKGTEIIPYKQGSVCQVYIRDSDGYTIQIASYMMPRDGNWRADDAFYDALVDLYKKRLKNWV